MDEGQVPSSGAMNMGIMEELYERFREDPASVDTSWRHFFEGMDFGLSRPLRKELSAPSDLRIHFLIHNYRMYGHLLAQFNPIDPHPVTEVPQLRLEVLGFEESELERSFPTCGLMKREEAPLRDIIEMLRETYCGKTGVEYLGIQRGEIGRWMQDHIEPNRLKPELNLEQKRQILECLNKAELFETFLHTKYVGQKRFSLEGGETLIPVLQAIISHGAEHGMEEFVIGMAHRGRLNVLANILNKSYANIFHEFEDTVVDCTYDLSGDVKYHKGFSADVTTRGGKEVHLAMAANPSHLESVNPVVQGMVRAKQVLKDDDVEMNRIAPLIIHGDAAMAGQGVVYETMQLCGLPGYGVGGTIHIVINNQIGFTTLPQDSRSTRYCTDVARGFSAPVFHVNGEDPEGCVWAAFMAVELRQRFGCDVFLDVNCYRKYGHNEADEPAFTQPLEYQMIRSKKSPREIYRDDLIQQGVIEKQMAEELEKKFREGLQKELDEVLTLQTEPDQEQARPDWQKVREANREEQPFERVKTAVPAERLRQLAEKLCKLPEDLNVHRKIKKLYESRLEMVEGDPNEAKINWGMAETLAYAALIHEGRHVRISGQDARRGTFNHRHAMLVDQKQERKYFPLNEIEGGRFDIFNSPLSEFACMGFEYGYSLSYAGALVIWEAQFGDFANGAQVAIDQYITTSEQKWHRLSGVVLLLPHGYEGQGPEHSSARMERFLQLAGEHNMRVCNPTTPAQMFHILRRQVIKPSRKPLVVFTPKELLGYSGCASSLNDLAEGEFEEIIDDPNRPEQTKRLVFCSGHVYYDLIKERERRGCKDTAIVRIEQLYPLHKERISEIIGRYEGFEECLWVQEEPRNMGAWEFIRPRLRDLLGTGHEPTYVGRGRSASPATGSGKKHKAQQAAIMDAVFGKEE